MLFHSNCGICGTDDPVPRAVKCLRLNKDVGAKRDGHGRDVGPAACTQLNSLTSFDVGAVCAGEFDNRGLVYDELGNYEHAVQDFSMAIDINSRPANVYYNRALTYRKLGKTAEAETDFKKYEELTGEKP